MVVFFIAILAYVVISDVVPPILEKDKKVIILNVILTTISFVVIVLYLAGVKLPKPTTAIEKFIQIIFGDLVEKFSR